MKSIVFNLNPEERDILKLGLDDPLAVSSFITSTYGFDVFSVNDTISEIKTELENGDRVAASTDIEIFALVEALEANPALLDSADPFWDEHDYADYQSIGQHLAERFTVAFGFQVIPPV